MKMLEIPKFITHLHFYKIQILFSVKEEIRFENKFWYSQIRGSIGYSLKNSKQYGYLYDEIFEKQNRPSALIILPENHQKNLFSKGDNFVVNITIVHPDVDVVNSLIGFLPEIKDAPFFTRFKLNFEEVKLFSPQKQHYILTKNLQHKKISDCKLDFRYIYESSVEWNDFLEIKFQTLFINRSKGILDRNITYENLLERIYKRTAELYQEYFEKDYTIPKIDFPEGKILFNTLESKKNILHSKDYSGWLGSIFYEARFSEISAHLLTLGSFLHFGVASVGGNGKYILQEPSQDFFSEFIKRLDTEISQTTSPDIFHEGEFEKIKSFNYVPEIVRKTSIPKSDGSYRELNIPSPKDTFLQKKLSEILSEKLDNLFLHQSFAYRKGKGAISAIKKIEEWKRKFPNSTIIRCDIDDFFDTVPKDILLQKLYYFTQDFAVCNLVEAWLNSCVAKNKASVLENIAGLPQGSPISPFLSNLYLHSLDVFISRQISKYFVRYADDIIILVPENVDSVFVISKLNSFIIKNLKLTLNNNYAVTPLSEEFSFLGIAFMPDNSLALANGKLQKMLSKSIQMIELDTIDFSKLKKYTDALKRYYASLLPNDDMVEIDLALYKNYLSYLSEHEKSNIDIDKLCKTGFITTEFKKPIEFSKDLKNKSKKIKTKTLQEKLKIQKTKFLKDIFPKYELIISQNGTSVGKDKQNLRISHQGKIIRSVAFSGLRHICLAGENIRISNSILNICAAKNILVSGYNRDGDCYMLLQNPDNLNAEIIKAQIKMSEENGEEVAQKIVSNKIKNQIKFLKYFLKYQNKSQLSVTLSDAIENLEKIVKQKPERENSLPRNNVFFIWEAHASLVYWKAFAEIIKNHGYHFEKRIKPNAPDLVNQMLNYAYAILANKVEMAILGSGLHPKIACFHSAENETVLVYDLMEQYRSFIADRAVVAILSKNSSFSVNENHDGLSWEIRKRIIAKINEYFSATVDTKKGISTLSDITYEIMENYISFCKGETKKLKLYNAKW